LTYCRCLLSLAKTEMLGRRHARADVLRGQALEHLRWLIKANPSSAAWLVYLQELGRSEQYELDWEDEHDQLVPIQETTFPQELRRYRRWRSERAGTARDGKTEAWVLQRSWSAAGSLIAVCSASDSDQWRRLPAKDKLDKLHVEYMRRSHAVDAQLRELGFSVEMVLLKIRLTAQYRRSIALYAAGNYVDHGPILELLQDARQKLGPLPELALAEAAYRQYIWDFGRAAAQFKNLQSAIEDRYIFREAVIGEAMALLQHVTYGPATSVGSLESTCRRILELTNGFAQIDHRASMAQLRARLELDQSLGPKIIDELIDLLSTSGTFPAMINKYRELLKIVHEEILLQDSSLHGWATLAEDFTNPRILLEFGSTLIRAHAINSADDFRYLRAGLCCLDGVRVMSQGGVRGIRQPFLVAKILLTAAEQSGMSTPLGWAIQTQGKDISDIEYAKRLFQSVHDRSVGGFRKVVRNLLLSSQELSKDL
jgi:hypothetical protein